MTGPRGEYVFDKTPFVRAAVAPGIRTWVLFSQGTFVVLDEDLDEPDAVRRARAVLAGLAEPRPGTGSADFWVTPLAATEGWVVRTRDDGVYVHVHPDELDSDDPHQVDVGRYARIVRQTDREDLEVLAVHRAAAG